MLLAFLMCCGISGFVVVVVVVLFVCLFLIVLFLF